MQGLTGALGTSGLQNRGSNLASLVSGAYVFFSNGAGPIGVILSTPV